jgi:hypothetical protein
MSKLSLSPATPGWTSQAASAASTTIDVSALLEVLSTKLLSAACVPFTFASPVHRCVQPTL